ncbi:hypothetical protein PHLGIDRAFT_331484 [Phlebiopsis gigantea 11061_1 CR5-6]|uniref:Uncharacterized protein n=1 Tax=Phlebiopsis gigantea (strain 11061_1 CR5-6) TaxID=745531 RepID=A0A0C3PWI2_PHLG1|nr:hypothetical protein PHLGIDRAFT_331484 [Phlebiopsis gigantea 11061_1 CR5-6]
MRVYRGSRARKLRSLCICAYAWILFCWRLTTRFVASPGLQLMCESRCCSVNFQVHPRCATDGSTQIVAHSHRGPTDDLDNIVDYGP